MAGSATILIFDPFNISATGNVLITIIAFIVMVLALVQVRNLKRVIKKT